MQKEKIREKVILFIISTVVVLLFVTVTAVSNLVKKGNVTYPVCTLKVQNDGYFYVTNNMFPYLYQFSDSPYLMGVPSEGIAYVEGGYAYNTGKGFGLTVSEISKHRSVPAYIRDVLGSLYSPYDGEELAGDYEKSGYLNGFYIEEKINRVKFDQHKNMLIISYALDVSSGWIVIVTYADEPDKEKLKEMRDYMDSMVYMTQNAARPDFETPEEVSIGTSGLYDDNAEDEISTVSADVTVEEDFRMLRLSFIYLDVEKTLDDIYVTDKDGKEYMPVSNGNGEAVFLIPDAKAGDVLTFSVTAGSLSGSYIEMVEQDEYESEQRSYSEGHLHVEDEGVYPYDAGIEVENLLNGDGI